MKAQLLLTALALWGTARGESLPFRGWAHSLRIENEALELVVVPATGRIVHLSRKGGENLLTFHEDTAGVLPPEEEGDWMNYGGDWLWPVHQDHWERMGGPRWPPLRILEQTWTGETEEKEDGSSVIVLRAVFGAPVHVAAERRIHLPPGDTPEFRIEQRLFRTQPSEVPVTLWQIAQIETADTIFLDRPPETRFEKGYQMIAFGDPGPEVLRVLDDAVLYRAGVQGHNKIGTDGSWVAARRGRDLLLLRTDGGAEDGNFPDGGCRVTIYSNEELGYTEIETQSAYHHLAPGESISNRVLYHLLLLEEDTPSSALPAPLQAPDRDRKPPLP